MSAMSNNSQEDETGVKLPKLIVFDLDYTLWPFWVDTHVDPPFHKKKDGTVIDSHGNMITLYKDVMDILSWLQKRNIKLGLASRTEAPSAGEQLIKAMDIDKFFHYKEIYPGRKVTHFNRFKVDSGIPFSEMVFFDDEERNIQDISRLGVLCIHVPDGMNMGLLQQGITRYHQTSNVSS